MYRCHDHSIGASIRRVTPIPRGSRPCIAAVTRSGARNASELRQVGWCAPPKHRAPAGLEGREVETAQARDLIIKCGVLLSHGISPLWTDLKPLDRC